jgi:hypothetical protein
LVHVRSCAFDGIQQSFGLQVEEALHHEETALIEELAMEEEFKFGSQLPRGHALDVVLFDVAFDQLSGKLEIKSERFVDWLATTSNWQLHPELLESL